MRELAEAELPDAVEAPRRRSGTNCSTLTLGGEDANRTRCVMEIRGGTGGDEAALFARDLYEMYKHYCEVEGLEDRNARHERHRTRRLQGNHPRRSKGEGVYRELQYESGGHRVQRVPETETKGRIHTSAATVAVMAEPEDVEIEHQARRLSQRHVLRERPRRSARQQDGIGRAAHALRDGHRRAVPGRKEPAQELRQGAARAEDAALRSASARPKSKKRSEERKTLVGSGDRSQRIRTYNFPENRVTDHRIDLTLYKLDQIIAGNLQPVTDALIDYDRQQLRDAFAVTE